jgi:hypothetical protein
LVKENKEYVGAEADVAEYNDLFLRGEMGLDIDGVWPSTINVAQMIAGDSAMFNILLSLCDAFPESDIAKKVWDIISLIPTHFDILHDLTARSSEFASPTHADWTLILPNNPLPKMAYLLEVMDYIFQSAPDYDSRIDDRVRTLVTDYFVRTEGFQRVVEILATTPNSSNFLHRNVLSLTLHIIHHFLFHGSTINALTDADDITVVDIPKSIDQKFLSQLLSSAAIVVDKLLVLAAEASSTEDTGTVQDALVTITALLQSSDEVAATLIGNPQAKDLVSTVLRSNSRKVRALASDFTVEIGKSQSVVFSWLVSVLENLEPSDTLCVEIFRSSKVLLEIKTKEESFPYRVNVFYEAEWRRGRLKTISTIICRL